MSKAGERLYNGIIKENPTFVLMLGMCPTLAVTTSAMNGLGMGLTTTVILAMSNLMISALRKVIPNVFASGVCTVSVSESWYLYPSDRSKLYHPWKSGSLCFFQSGHPVFL